MVVEKSRKSKMTSALKRAEDKQDKAFAALAQFVRECEITGIQPTKRKRKQREMPLLKLVLKIEEAAQEALRADLLNDIENEKEDELLRSSKLRLRR